MDRTLECCENQEFREVLVKLEQDSTALSALLAIKYIQGGRRLFISAGNRLGFADSRILPGDRVCIFDGSMTAHVIREINSQSREKEYILVAESYLHGAMNGEVDGWGLESEEITLL
jgi:hypothetical protein